MGKLITVQAGPEVSVLLRRSMGVSADEPLEEVTEPAELISLLEGGEQVDAVVLGSGLEEPVRVAQRIHSMDKEVAILILSDPVRHRQLARALRFAPLLGEDVSCLSSAQPETVVGEASEAVARIRKRRSYRATIAAASAHVARLSPPLRRAEQYLDRLLDHAPIGVVTVNEHGQILAWNRKAGGILGKSEREVLGIPLASLFPEGEWEKLDRSIAGCFASGEQSPPQILQRRTTEGRPQFLETTAAALAGSTGERGAMVIIQDATERRRAEEALLESEERFRATFEQAAVGVAHVGPDGRWLRINDKLCEITGYPREELLGMSFQDITHPDDLQEDLDHLRRLSAGEIGTYSTEKRYFRKDGSVVWVNLTVSAVGDASGHPKYFITVVEDINERKRAEEDLSHSEERYRSVVEQMSEGLFLFDAETKRILETNPAFQELLGYTAEELERMRVYDLVPDDPESVDRNVRRNLIEGQLFVGERLYRRKDGSAADVEVSGNVISYGGREVLCAVARDISERKRNEDALRFMAEVGAELSSSLDYRVTLAKVARLTVPTLADWCAVDVLEKDGSLGRLAIVHEDPEKVELARRLRERYPPDPDAPHGAPRVLRTGEPELVEEIPEELLDRVARDAGHRETLRGLGLESYMAVPLVARGRTLGALTLVAAGSGRRYGEADLELAEELARRAALAVDNARLYEEARRELAERERAEERFRLLVESATDYAILMLTADGRVTSWNPGARRILGYAEEEILGERFSLFFIEEDRKSGRPERELRRAITEGRASNDNWAVRKDGSRFWASGVTTALRDREGNLRGLAKILRDRTEARRAQEALREVREAERVRMGRDLHDGPLQDLSYALVEMEVIRTFPDEPDADARLERAIGALRGASRGMRDAVNDLRLGEEQNRPLPRLVEALVERSRGMAPGTEIDMVVRDGVPSAPLGDARTDLLRVVQEALTNTRKHSGAERVRVSLGAEGDELVIEVADDGRGFASGTPAGIGLRSMRERAESLGGELELESEPGEGTRVRLRVPMRRLLRKGAETEPGAEDGGGARI